jgi:hypothetical protein
MQEILLVEDRDDDAELTARAFRKARIMNPLIRARDGVEALDYLLGRGAHAGRDVTDVPASRAFGFEPAPTRRIRSFECDPRRRAS